MKRKGTYVERKIAQKLKDKGWIVIRSTGSFGQADLVCIREGKAMFIECKSTKNEYQYLTKEEVEALMYFSKVFGGEAWIGVRFGKEWFFLNPEDLKESKKHFGITKEHAKIKGLLFEEMIKE